MSIAPPKLSAESNGSAPSYGSFHVSTITIETTPARPAEVPRGQILLEPPPELPEGGADGMTQALLYLPMAAMAVGTAVMLAGGHAGAVSYVGAGAMGIGMVGMMAGQLARGHSDRTLKLSRLRRDYLRYLSQVRARVGAAAHLQREDCTRSCPPPAALPALVAARKIWDRVPGTPGFLDVRFGTGPGEPLLRPVLPEAARPEAAGPADDLDPLTTGALHRFVRASSVIPALPATIRLSSWDRITLTGDPAAVRDLTRAVVAQLAVTHSPADVLVTVCADGTRMHEWEWAKWLPHTMHPSRADAAGPVRLMTQDPRRVPELLGQLRDDRTFHVIVADSPVSSERLRIPAAVVLDVSGTPAATSQPTLALRVTTDSLTAEDGTELGLPDAVTRAAAESLGRQLAPLRPAPADRSAASARASATLAGLLGIADPRRPDPAALRQRRSARDLLRVPIGTLPDGSPVELDIKESAQGGMGPHGLVVGATGSGKSELLRTLVLGLALTHDPGELNFVLVDFKGGATFLGMDALPHVSAVITNLADELPLVDRMRDALAGELVRRQEVLRAAGHASLREHRAAGRQLPALFLVLDEFSELLSAKPEFAELFVTIGRVGRSLGVHLLLASQRLEEGKLRGLDTQLSYRIGLRTFNTLESRTVLGVPDAYELPAEPGHGYLKADGTLTRFRAAYVSGPVAAPEPAVPAALPVVVEFGPAYASPPVASHHNEPAPQETDSFLRTVVARLAGNGPAARQIWLPPLAEPPSLDQLPRAEGLRAAVGVVDKPFEQRRDPLWADLSGAGGHAAVVGAPRTGKSVLLRTLVSSLALGHTPDQARFYILDFGGGTLAGLDGLPHVGGVATRLHADRVRRTVAEVRAMLEERERVKAAQCAEVFLVVDGWLTLQQEFEDLEPTVTTLAARGLGYGVHVIASAAKWSQFRPTIRDLFGTRLELRLGDPYESEAGRAAAGRVPAGRPGRGLTPDGLHFLAAVPRTDGVCSADGLAAAAAELVKELAASWTGPAAPAVRLLPDSLPTAALPAAAAGSVPFGIDENALAPVRADFTADPHFMVFGDTECGKSNLLRVLCAGLMSSCPPEQARLVFVDYRRSLLELTGSEHSIGYATSSVAAARLLDDVREALVGRLPPPDLPLAQLRSRSWWSGAELYVVVDDYDLVASGPGGGPLGSLLELLPQAGDIGFHLILARSVGGAGRAMFDPVIQRLREMGTPGVIMSGHPDEGVLLGGVRPAPLPPGRGVLVRRRVGNSLVQVARSAQVPT
jgi:DNA segregation ATPase FtsK/SpoIIIE, S-DNA-T family